MAKFYNYIHALDFKYTTTVFETVQKYTLLRTTSKVLGLIFDVPALPVFLFFYLEGAAPHIFLFTFYLTGWILLHEMGIKRIFNRHRPATAGVQKGYSFPSSHSFTSGIIIATCVLFALPLSPLLITLATLNAINRAAIGVHYLADIIVGLTLGVFAGALWPVILRTATAFLG